MGSNESSESFPPTKLANGTWTQRFIINGKEEIRPFYGRGRGRDRHRNRTRNAKCNCVCPQLPGETPQIVEKRLRRDLIRTIESIPKSGQVDGRDLFHP